MSAQCKKAAHACVWLMLCIAAVSSAASMDQIDRAIAARDFEAARSLLDDALAADPGNDGLRFKRARVRGYLGEHAGALHDYDHLRQKFPLDVDYALGRARVLAWLGRDAEALAELEAAEELAPDYEAVWRLEFSIRSRQSGAEAARRLEELRAACALRFPQSSWWQPPASDPSRRWVALVGVGYEELSDSLPSWDNQFLELHWERTERITHILRLARDARFDESDTLFGLGSEWRSGGDWFAGVKLASSSSPSFAPELELSGHIGTTLDAGWVVDLRYRRREYASATVGSLIAGAEKYFGDFRVAYSLGVSHLHGASDSLGHALHGNWYPSDRFSIGLSLATGEEAESVGPGRVLETDVRGLSLNGRHRITDRVGVNWWAGIHEQGDFYRRRYLGMAVSIRL